MHNVYLTLMTFKGGLCLNRMWILFPRSWSVSSDPGLQIWKHSEHTCTEGVPTRIVIHSIRLCCKNISFLYFCWLTSGRKHHACIEMVILNKVVVVVVVVVTGLLRLNWDLYRSFFKYRNGMKLCYIWQSSPLRTPFIYCKIQPLASKRDCDAKIICELN